LKTVIQIFLQKGILRESNNQAVGMTWPQTKLWPVSHGSKKVASGGCIPAKVASEKWIPWIPQKNPASQSRDSASL
jgi:hypothetical protein